MRNLPYAIERITACSGVRLTLDGRPLQVVVFDNKQGVEESLILPWQVTGKDTPFLVQGSRSAVATALVEEINKHNQRSPADLVLFLSSAGRYMLR